MAYCGHVQAASGNPSGGAERFLVRIGGRTGLGSIGHSPAGTRPSEAVSLPVEAVSHPKFTAAGPVDAFTKPSDDAFGPKDAVRRAKAAVTHPKDAASLSKDGVSHPKNSIYGSKDPVSDPKKSFFGMPEGVFGTVDGPGIDGKALEMAYLHQKQAPEGRIGYFCPPAAHHLPLYENTPLGFRRGLGQSQPPLGQSLLRVRTRRRRLRPVDAARYGQSIPTQT